MKVPRSLCDSVVDNSTGEVDSGAASAASVLVLMLSKCAFNKTSRFIKRLPKIASRVSQTLLAKTVQRSAAAQLIMALTLQLQSIGSMAIEKHVLK